jgi:uncharacterized membrane protein
VFIVAAIVYTFFHYRSVRKIPSSGRKLTSLFHLLALLVLVVILAMPVAKVRYSKTYRPVMLILVDTSRSMAETDKRTTNEALAEAAQILNGLPFDKKVGDDVIQQYLKKNGESSRLDLVKAIFKHPDIDLLKRASERFEVRFFSFDQSLAPEGGAKDAEKWLAAREANGEASRIGTAIDEAVSRYTGLPVAGVMVFSDFGWVNGEDPARVADKLKSRGIPVYPISIGLPSPPDAMITEIIAPEAVFQGDPVNLRIRLHSRGLDGRNSTVKLKIDGVETETQALVFADGMQFVEIKVQPKQSKGTLKLEFIVDGTALDSNLKNNIKEHSLRIIEEKIKVLYIEGVPRWEFRYLRWALLRNRNLQTRFLMTQGDPELAKLSPHFMARFPKDIRNIFEYDLIILGDVSSKYFKPEQLELLEEQIRTHGGSLIVLAGNGSMPASYRNTALERILPVRIGAGKSHSVANNVFPRLPKDDIHSPIVVLNDSADANQRIWSKVKPLGRLPALDGAKPLANVLLQLPSQTAGGAPYPLVSWQNYGKGKCMFVATDRLWKMRREVGDLHHAKFWGQSIQFLAMSRLLGQNKRISLQTERSRYNPGEAVRVYANVLTETYQPMVKENHTVVIERKDVKDSAQDLLLIPDPSTPGVYFGSLPAGSEGDYVLRGQTSEAEVTGSVEFAVATDPLEDRDTGAKPEIAASIAKAAGTKVVAPGDLAELVENIAAPEISRVVSRELELWDTPILYILLLIFVGMEWILRRRENLL